MATWTPAPSIFSHDIYDNVRTRVLVLYRGCLLLHPPQGDDEAWCLPGGGLEPHESLAECAAREVREETGLRVRVGRIAFLQEWVVPRYTPALHEGEGYGFGLEVFHYASPEEPVPDPAPEFAYNVPALWVPFGEVAGLPLWPKELKDLCARLGQGEAAPAGILSFLGHLESPWTRSTVDPFAAHETHVEVRHG